MPYESRPAYFSIVDSDGATTRDISAHLTSIDGLPGERELVDVTRFGDSGHRFVASLFNGRFSMEGLYDKTVSTGLDTIMNNLLDMTTATTFIFAPTGISCGATPVNRKVSGAVWLKTYTIPARVGTAVVFRADFQVEGKIATGTCT